MWLWGLSTGGVNGNAVGFGKMPSRANPAVLGEKLTAKRVRVAVKEWGILTKLKSGLFHVGAEKAADELFGFTESLEHGNLGTTRLHVGLAHAKALVLGRAMAPENRKPPVEP